MLAVLPESHPDAQVRRRAAPLLHRGRFRAQDAASLRAACAASQLVLGFERGEPPSRPFSIDTLRSFIVFLTTTQELPAQGRWRTVSGEAKLRGGGAGAPFVDLHFWAIKATENAFSLTSNVDSPPIQSRLTQLWNAHISHSAPSYDVVEVRGVSPAEFTFPQTLRSLALCLVNTRSDGVAAAQRSDAAGRPYVPARA